ncbi:MAG: limonene-1,2-epoxide hydrolase family protein [Acidimicrobiia bacterium]
MSAEDIVNTFMARITALDFDGAFGLVAADIEYDNVPIGKVEGPDGIRSVFAQLDAMGVDGMEWVVHRQVAGEVIVMNERTDKFRAHGKWAEVAVAGVFEVHDGVITLWRDYFDMNAMTAAITELAG